MVFIECCLSNVTTDSRLALNEVGHEVRETMCLDRCGTCHDQPFLVIDGDIHTGDSHQNLINSVVATDEVLEQ